MPDPISWSIALPYMIAALAFGYLLGSIPFGLIFTKLAGHGDVRDIGSGSIGATNVLRTGSKKFAAATVTADIVKGTAAVMIAAEFGPDQAVMAGLGAFLGHCFPVWLKFKGGKGAATYFGITIAVLWKVALIFMGIWILNALITRYSSVSSLLASLATPIALYWFGYVQWAELFALLTLIVWIKHHSNFKRLFNGSESKIGQKG